MARDKENITIIYISIQSRKTLLILLLSAQQNNLDPNSFLLYRENNKSSITPSQYVNSQISKSLLSIICLILTPKLSFSKLLLNCLLLKSSLKFYKNSWPISSPSWTTKKTYCLEPSYSPLEQHQFLASKSNFL